jgi:peptide deformylase
MIMVFLLQGGNMAIRNIRTDEDAVLRKKSREITKFDTKLKVLVEDMIETMYDADGIGLAAPQIGLLKRLIVIDLYDEEGVKVLINPEIIEESGTQNEIEGCLSLPGKAGRVVRPFYVKVKGKDIDGNEVIMEGEDLLARAFCHEIDHLEGILFTDNAVMVDFEDEEEEEE